MEPLPHWSLSVGKISHGANCQQSNGTDCVFLGILMHFRLHIANFRLSYLRGSLACEQALGGMEGERKGEGLYAHLKFYCSAPFLTFL